MDAKTLTALLAPYRVTSLPQARRVEPQTRVTAAARAARPRAFAA